MQKTYLWQRGLILIVSLASIFALPSMAVASVTDVVDPSPTATIERSLFTLPPCDNQKGLTEVFSSTFTESSVTFIRYNDDFQKTGEFTENLPSYSNEYVDQVCIPVFETETSTDESNYTLEELETKDFTREDHDGQIWWIRSWYDSYTYGKRFPSWYYMWDGSKMYECYISYHETGNYTDEWIDYKTQTYPRKAEIYDARYIDSNGYDYVWACLSKHFFNADDNYEYLMEELTYQESIQQYSPNERRVARKYALTGILIKNDKGETLGRIPAKEAYTVSVYLANLGSKHYVGVYYYNPSETSETQWYKVNTASNGSALVPVAKIPIGVSPRVARRSIPVTVTVPTDAGAERVVTVVSTTGRVLLTRTLSPESDSLSIDTTDFAQGVYIVNVTCGASVTENCKIVIQ